MPLENNTSRLTAKWFWVALITLTVLASGTRFFKLADSSFFNDELYTARSALDMSDGNISKALGYMPARIALAIDGVDRTATDHTRPETWQAAGIDKYSLRWPHALIGVLTIPILILAGRRALGDPAAILFGLLLAFSAWHIYWSQSARFYILQFLFFNLALLLWIPATRVLSGHKPAEPIGEPDIVQPVRVSGGSTSRFAFAMVAAFLAFWSQPVSLMLFGILGLDWLWALFRKNPLAMNSARYAIGIAAGLLCVAMLAWDMTQRTEQWTAFVGQDAWLKPHELVLAVGFFVWPATAALVAAASLWLLTSRPKLGVPLVLAAVCPTIIFAVISLNNGFIGSRYAFVSLGPILMIAALALTEITKQLWDRAGIFLAAAPLAAVLMGQLFATAIYFRSGGAYHLPMDQAAAYLAVHRDPSETVYAHEEDILKFLLQDDNIRFETYLEDSENPVDLSKPCWFVRGTSHSGDSLSNTAPGETLVASFRLQQIHSRAEVRVYRYTPPME